jgi:hypothetical protein
MRVEVYFNLHKRVFSVRNCKTGRVIYHTSSVQIKDPTFVVRKSGRLRVLRERKKNVHAFVRGEIMDTKHNACTKDRLYYNPYEVDSFMVCKTNEPIDKAKEAYLYIDSNNKPVILADGV